LGSSSAAKGSNTCVVPADEEAPPVGLEADAPETVVPSAARATRNVWPHFVQRTLTPFSVTFSSGILKRVWHWSHLTIMGEARLQPGLQTRGGRV